eukprot:SAG11_NODE_1601_length_4605_cov_2.581891_3_plen_173_part_00
MLISRCVTTDSSSQIAKGKEASAAHKLAAKLAAQGGTGGEGGSMKSTEEAGTEAVESGGGKWAERRRKMKAKDAAKKERRRLAREAAAAERRKNAEGQQKNVQRRRKLSTSRVDSSEKMDAMIAASANPLAAEGHTQQERKGKRRKRGNKVEAKEEIRLDEMISAYKQKYFG